MSTDARAWQGLGLVAAVCAAFLLGRSCDSDADSKTLELRAEDSLAQKFPGLPRTVEARFSRTNNNYTVLIPLRTGQKVERGLSCMLFDDRGRYLNGAPAALVNLSNGMDVLGIGSYGPGSALDEFESENERFSWLAVPFDDLSITLGETLVCR